ncbi:MAG: Asp-tRNA(Asn)/Glu-tRNA(Gln) amidotransferase GatCAB subunit B, partial [Methanothrix sp.]|nr:Asp-tRNA(Asn)/Glu-tRNA(Gln) amidotransferase GatCAB subunit B [Methanothrix sp.]
LTSEIRVANFYEDVAKRAPPRLAAVWIADVLKGELNYRDVTIDKFSPDHMVEILGMLEKRTITEKGAVEVIRIILDTGGDPSEVVEAGGLAKAEDDAVKEAVFAAVAECSQAVADYRSGNEKAINFIVGMVMKKTRGRADPGEANRLVKEALEEI